MPTLSQIIATAAYAHRHPGRRQAYIIAACQRAVHGAARQSLADAASLHLARITAGERSQSHGKY
jgi:hypothetical protein